LGENVSAVGEVDDLARLPSVRHQHKNYRLWAFDKVGRRDPNAPGDETRIGISLQRRRHPIVRRQLK
jgi:hypothetical protein